MNSRTFEIVIVVFMIGVGVFFEQERTTFVDLAFHLYQQVTTGEMSIQNFRFVSALTQILPTKLLGSGVAMPLVQLVYSLVFPLFYASIWGILRFWLKNQTLAIAWLLTWATFAVHTHFRIQSELPQGLALFCLTLGLLTFKGRQVWLRVAAQVLLPLLVMAVAFAHPLLIVPVTFAFGLLILQEHRGFSWSLKVSPQVMAALLLYYAFYAIRVVFFKTSYDATAGGFLSPVIQEVLAGDLPYSFVRLAQNLVTIYWPFVLVFAIGLYLLWSTERRYAAIWTAGAVVGHLLLVALSYPTDQVVDFYIENLYLPAG